MASLLEAVFMQKHKPCNEYASLTLILRKLVIFLEFSWKRFYVVPSHKVQGNHDWAQPLSSKFKVGASSRNLWLALAAPGRASSIID